MTTRPPPRDAGTVVPLLALGFLLAVTLLAASTAGGAALVARRELAADCDAAALAGATALDRAALRTRSAEPSSGRAPTGQVPPGSLPLDPVGVLAAVRAATPPGTAVEAATDGITVTVRCRRTVAVPFGAVLGRPHGVDRTALSRARTRTRPPN